MHKIVCFSATLLALFVSRQQLTNNASNVAEKQTILCMEFNRLVQGGSLFSTNLFGTNRLKGEAEFWRARSADTNSTARLNRVLIEESFPDDVRKCYRFGPEEMLSVNPILVMIIIPIM